jgi:hypothetical protein
MGAKASAGGRNARRARRQQMRATQRQAEVRASQGISITLPWPRVADRSRWLAAVLGPESVLWAVLLLVVPVLAIGVDLTVGLHLNQTPLVDYDYWWHLGTGNWILDHHRVPTTDPFSWTHLGQNWIAHEWLAELFLALAVRAGGYAGAIVFTFLVAVVGYWRLIASARYYGLSRRAAVVVTLLWGGAFLRVGVLTVRPQIWTLTLLAVLLAELAAYDTGRRRQLWLVPPLFALWINLNLTALIGIACLGIFVLDHLVRRRFNPREVDRHLVLIGVLSVAALLVNPRHIHLLILSFSYGDPAAIYRKYVFEWMSPRFDDPSQRPFWLAIPMVIPAVWYLVRRQPKLWPGLAVIGMAYEAYDAMRYVPIYVMICFTFAGWLFWQRAQERGTVPDVADQPLVPRRPWALALPLASTALVLALALSKDQSQFRRDPVAWGHPVDATNYLMAHYPNARLFNTYDFGGYLIYRFYGTNQKVYIDGRAEMFGDAELSHYFDLIYGNPGWQDDFDKMGIQMAMVRRIDGISVQLANDSHWKLVYQDGANLIFVRLK